MGETGDFVRGRRFLQRNVTSCLIHHPTLIPTIDTSFVDNVRLFGGREL